MCNLYSIIRTQEAMRRLFRFHRDLLGNFPGLPAVYPDTMAPVVRTAREGDRELYFNALGLSAAAEHRQCAGHQRPQSRKYMQLIRVPAANRNSFSVLADPCNRGYTMSAERQTMAVIARPPREARRRVSCLRDRPCAAHEIIHAALDNAGRRDQTSPQSSAPSSRESCVLASSPPRPRTTAAGWFWFPVRGILLSDCSFQRSRQTRCPRARRYARSSPEARRSLATGCRLWPCARLSRAAAASTQSDTCQLPSWPLSRPCGTPSRCIPLASCESFKSASMVRRCAAKLPRLLNFSVMRCPSRSLQSLAFVRTQAHAARR